jgi:hypothetical protein
LTKSAWRDVSTMFDELKALADKRTGPERVNDNETAGVVN